MGLEFCLLQKYLENIVTDIALWTRPPGMSEEAPGLWGPDELRKSIKFGYMSIIRLGDRHLHTQGRTMGPAEPAGCGAPGRRGGRSPRAPPAGVEDLAACRTFCRDAGTYFTWPLARSAPLGLIQ